MEILLDLCFIFCSVIKSFSSKLTLLAQVLNLN